MKHDEMKQEPVAWYITEKGIATTDWDWAEVHCHECEPLYTHPAQPKREPLKYKRIMELWAEYNPLLGIESFVRSVEKDHGITKEKNT